MARSSQYWVMFLVVLFVAAASGTLVGADEAAPTIAEQAEANAHAAQEKAHEAAATITEKLEAAKELGVKESEQVGEAVNTWKNWAWKTAGEWSGKGKAAAGDFSESAKVSGAKAQESATGMFNQWSNWAKETAGKYKPKKNPAAEAAAYINKHATGSTEEEL